MTWERAILTCMLEYDPKSDLHYYLKAAREALLWKLDGLSEYDVRRPMTPTGTNLLGLIKHVAGVEFGYFGETFGTSTGVMEPPAPMPAPPPASSRARRPGTLAGVTANEAELQCVPGSIGRESTRTHDKPRLVLWSDTNRTSEWTATVIRASYVALSRVIRSKLN